MNIFQIDVLLMFNDKVNKFSALKNIFPISVPNRTQHVIEQALVLIGL